MANKTPQEHYDEAMKAGEMAKLAYFAAASDFNDATDVGEQAQAKARADEAEADAKKATSRAQRAGALMAYDSMIERVKDAENQPLALMRLACETLTIALPRFHVKKKKGEQVGEMVCDTVTVPIVLYGTKSAEADDALPSLQERNGGKLGANNEWYDLAGAAYALAACAKKKVIAEGNDPISRWYKGKANVLGRENIPETSSQWDKAFKTVVAAMIGDAKGYVGKDREYILTAMAAKGRSPLTIKMCGHDVSRLIFEEVCHRIITKARYDVV